MSKISVIIPVYKVEAYLDRCVESVLAQTYKDFELILVDDGSPDRCGEMCDGWAKRDARIRVIHQANAGLGAARNAGAAVATGKYIAFVDSDDVVDPEIWSKSIAYAERLNLQMVLFEEVQFEDATGAENFDNWTRCRLPAQCHGRAFTRKDIKRSPFHTCCYAHNRIVLREFYGQRKFPEGVLYEDAPMHYELLFDAKRIGAIEEPLYRYRLRGDSLMKRADARVLDHIKVLRMVEKTVYSRGLGRKLFVEFADYQSGMASRCGQLNPEFEFISEAFRDIVRGKIRPRYPFKLATSYVWAVIKKIIRFIRHRGEFANTEDNRR